jgi:hypothetical protein
MEKSVQHRVVVFTITGALLLAVAVFIFFTVGPWLVVSDPLPRRLDIIFTFAGANERMTYSRELMKQNEGAHWVLSDFHHFYSRILSRNGFDMTRVSIVDTAANTLSEVNGLSDWLRSEEKAGRKTKVRDTAHSPARQIVSEPITIGLVSSPYHMRRISFMVDDVFRKNGKEFRFCYLPVPFDKFSWTRRDLRTWWRSKTLRAYVGSEVGKLLMYWLFR